MVGLTSDNGTVSRTYDYSAFGIEENPDEEDLNPFRYCGEYFDSETGTYYLRARYYDPSIGRFTQPDSHWNSANRIYGDDPRKINEREDALGNKLYSYSPEISAIVQSGNLYVYGMNNPIMYIDNSGEIVIWSIMLIGAVVGGAINAGYNIYSQVSAGATAKDLKWKSIGVSFATGAISGAVAGSPIGTGGQVVINALLSGGESILQDKIYNRDVDLGRAAISAGIGALAGLAGGSGAQAPRDVVYGKFSCGNVVYSVVRLKYYGKAAAQAAAKSLAKGLTKAAVTQILLNETVVEIIYEEK